MQKDQVQEYLLVDSEKTRSSQGQRFPDNLYYSLEKYLQHQRYL